MRLKAPDINWPVFWGFLTLIVMAGLTAQAQGVVATPDTATDPLPHYVRSGAGFACTQSKADFEKSQAEKRDPCLTIGPLFVGMPRAEAEATLGKPATSVDTQYGNAYAYALQSEKGKAASTYAILTFAADDRTSSIQVTGLAWKDDWKFAGLALGAPQETVTARLGQPLQIKNSDDPGSVEWAYLPWSFSLEVKGGVLSSIKVWAQQR